MKCLQCKKNKVLDEHITSFCPKCLSVDLGERVIERTGNFQLDEVTSIDEARSFLKETCLTSFKDTCFQNYIEKEIAGDFAVEIANVIIREKNRS